MNLFKLLDTFPTDDACREHLERTRWPDGVRCPRCGGDKIARLRKRKQYSCKMKECGYRFSATTDTIFHASKIPLKKWFVAIYQISNAKKSVSSLQLARELKISNECAWHMCMRIREAMREDQADLFGGVVVCDEYYHGGNPRKLNKGRAQPPKAIKGTSHIGLGSDKQPVIGVYEKNSGRIRTAVIPDAKSQTLMNVLTRWCKISGTELVSDEWLGYKKIGRMCKMHRTVKHAVEYVAADGTHNNHVESAWSLFNRSVIGSFHKISVKHLPRYLGEFDARFNARKENGSFFPRIIRQTVGRRLPMAELIEGNGLGAECR